MKWLRNVNHQKYWDAFRGSVYKNRAKTDGTIFLERGTIFLEHGTIFLEFEKI